MPRRPGGLPSAVLDRGDVELELDLVRHHDAAGLERSVPGQAPVLAADGGLAFETDPNVAVGVLGRAGVFEAHADRPGDALDGQVTGDRPLVVALTFNRGGDERDLGVLPAVEEVPRAEVVVALLLASGDAVRDDRDRD